MSTARNPNKIINITRSDNSDSSWKSNLSRILSDYQDSSEFFVRNNNIYALNATVDLLLEKFPEFKFENKIEQPFEKFFSDKKTNLGKLSSFIITGSGVVNSLIDRFSGGASDNKTAETWNPWLFNVPAHEGGSGSVKFSYTFKFALGQYGLWNAKKEVILPALNLIAPAMNQRITPVSTSTAFPKTADLIVKLLTGDGIGNAIDSFENTKSLSNSLYTFLTSVYNKFSYDIRFGDFVTIKKCIIEKADIQFGNQLDNNGYPVTAEVTLSFVSIIPPALSSLDQSLSVKFGV